MSCKCHCVSVCVEVYMFVPLQHRGIARSGTVSVLAFLEAPCTKTQTFIKLSHKQRLGVPPGKGC